VRQPKPWYWRARKKWCVTIGGVQKTLASGEKEATKKEAWASYHRLMASEGRLDGRQAARMTVADVCEAFLVSTAKHCRASTVELYTRRIGPFAAAFKNKPVDGVTSEDVIGWLRAYGGCKQKGKEGFGDSVRALTLRVIRTMFRWARDRGIIKLDPLARVASPWRIQARERPMTDEEYALIRSDAKTDDSFKEVLELMWRTGMRPDEVAKLSARNLDARLPIARFQPVEHKTGTRTGLQLERFFPPDMMDRVRGYAKVRRGPLIRNGKGEPWTQHVISCRFSRLKKRLGLPNDCVIYLARHRFITRLVESGVPLARVAKLAGHTHPETVMKHYYHPDTLAMLEDVARIDGGGEKPATDEDGRPLVS
jgi:integrase